MNELNIYQRINNVRKKVDYAQKEKQVESYKAVTHDQITALTRNHFIDQGIVIVPVEVESKTIETGTTTGKGVPYIRFEPKYEIHFVNIDSPEDRATVVITSHALDHGDKAPGKAISYAVKYAILKILNIETGEDEESRAEQNAKADDKLLSEARSAAMEGMAKLNEFHRTHQKDKGYTKMWKENGQSLKDAAKIVDGGNSGTAD